MLRKLQILGASAFVAFALVFAATQLNAPVASAAQSGFGCCIYPSDCAGGMVCKGEPTGCPAQNPSYTGRCVSSTPGPAQPTYVPGPISRSR